MIHALLHNKLKDSFSDPHFKPSEDSLTSSIIGLLSYLPDNIFWKLLKNSCGIQSSLPEDIGEILSINFWDKLMADGVHNSTYVEPDVWIECRDCDIIIEAKKYDSWGQEMDQWKKEILSYSKTFEDNKHLIFIALGGNVSLQDYILDIDGNTYTIYTSSWYNLLNEVDKYLTYLLSDSISREERGYIRLLNDLITIFAKHGYLKTEWLDSMEHIKINRNSTSSISEFWEFDNKILLQDFYKPYKHITTNNISDIWKIN